MRLSLVQITLVIGSILFAAGCATQSEPAPTAQTNAQTTAQTTDDRPVCASERPTGTHIASTKCRAQ